MKKLILILLISFQLKAVLPPGSCKEGEVQILAEGLRAGGQCVSEKNLNETLHYINNQLNLNVSDRELVRACNELKRNNIETALQFLNLNNINTLQENKIKILKSACKALEFGFLPEGPEYCEVPGYPRNETFCDKNDWIQIQKPNRNCQKFDLKGKCLEFGECPLY